MSTSADAADATQSHDSGAVPSDGPRTPEEIRDVLRRVASGELDTDEADRLLSAGRSQADGAPTEPVAPTEEHRAANSRERGGSDRLSYDEAYWSGERTVDPSAEAAAASSIWSGVTDDPRGEARPARPAGRTADGVDAGDDRSDDRGDDRSGDGSDALPASSQLQRVLVRALGRRVRIVGDPGVTGVAVDGSHRVKRDGNTVQVTSDGDLGLSVDPLSVLRTRSFEDVKTQVKGLAQELTVRVNPALDVEAEVTGGALTVARLPRLRRVRLTGGSAKVTDAAGGLDILVQAGHVTLDTRLTKGFSRVRVETGGATIALRRGSDVRVRSDAQLGRVTWSGAVTGTSSDVEIGRGRARLDVQVLAGAVQVSAD